MVAHEKRNPAQLFCAVPTQNDLALSSLLFSAHPTQKLGYPNNFTRQGRAGPLYFEPALPIISIFRPAVIAVGRCYASASAKQREIIIMPTR